MAAGRKPKGYDVEQKLSTYLETYDLDDLNKANDYASLRQLAHFEVIINNLQTELASIKSIGADSKKVKDLNTALRDAVNSYTQLQITLGINRSKRQSEADESVVSYLEKLKQQAPKFLDSRYKSIVCPDCTAKAKELSGDERQQIIGKYLQYVTHDGEFGSIEADKHPPKELKFTIRMECPFCHKIVEQSNE